MAGTEQVVLGDLVYCKDNDAAKGTGLVGLECADGCKDGDDSFNEDEVSGTDVPEETNSHFKVSEILAHY